MSLTQHLSEYIRACFTGLWIESSEHQDAIVEIAQLCSEQEWRLATWNIESGLQIPGTEINESSSDPLAAIHSVHALADSGGTAILILENFHRFLQSAEIIQALSQQVLRGKQNRAIIVILAPVVQLPIELQKLFSVITHELPNRDQLQEIAAGITTEDGEMPEGDDLERVLDAATGLTRYESENAFSLALVRDGRLNPETLWQQKAQMLKKSGLLQLYRGGDDFGSLGGLTSLKSFTCRALLQPSRSDPLKRARGVLLLSPPGCGKSQFCKALGQEVGRPVLMLDVGSLMGSLVGQSEERTRQALQIIDSMAPCVLMIDKIEKAFAGVGSSGQIDSGVSARMFGTFLSWLNDHESDVFVVCTSNDVAKLPPEFGRSERFDGIFFLDLPGREQKDEIWSMYMDLFELDREQRRPDDDSWTGAEIRSCCRLAALLDLPIVQSAQNVVPVSVTSAESIEQLRNWASGRCLDADNPGIYRLAKKNGATRRRRVSRGEPSNN